MPNPVADALREDAEWNGVPPDHPNAAELHDTAKLELAAAAEIERLEGELAKATPGTFTSDTAPKAWRDSLKWALAHAEENPNGEEDFESRYKEAFDLIANTRNGVGTSGEGACT